MKKLFIVLTIVLFSLNVGYAIAESEKTILATVSYALSREEIERYRSDAMAGSPEAATKLMNYYIFERKDAKKSDYWAIVGAENGSAESQFRMYQVLGISSDPLKQKRALYWLRQSSNNGYLIANKIFETCNSLTSRYTDEQHSPCFGPGSQD